MEWRRFSWWLKVPVVAAALVGLPFVAVGCGGDDTPECNGVLRDGKCYANCDEAIDCKGDPNLKCVAYTNHPEGKCFATCKATTDCKAGEICATGAVTMKGEHTPVCASRAEANLPPGKLGDACTDPSGCDEASGLSCVEGKCRVPEGGGCTSNDNCGTGYVCFGGVCAAAVAQPGERCGEGRACDPDQGLACHKGNCLYTCSSHTGCGEGFFCDALAAPGPAGEPGACVKGGDDQGPGRYGTSCPKATVCDKDAGFECVGPKSTTDAICTKKNGCTTDDDCPAGLWCGAIANAKDAKGNIDFDNPIKLCQRRDFCAPCKTDLDCSYVPNAICVADKDGETFCSTPCEPKSNSCIIGSACVDTGGGRFACRPDAGVCHAKDAPTGCEPCRIDSDCGKGALCREGTIGNKPGVKWCEVPCGAPDKDGKRACPKTQTGAEMVCLDENEYSLGGPFNSKDFPNSVYGMCFRPLTVDNTVESKGDPPINACGNARREGTEECDDGNPFASDGCGKDCKITAECRFTLDDADAEGKAMLRQGEQTFAVVPSTCKSFLIEGTLKQAGETDTYLFDLPDGASTWVEVFTDKIGTCSADLIATVQTGTYDPDTDTLDVDSDPTTPGVQLAPCDKLSNAIKNLDAETPTLCKEGNYLACGSCAQNGLCGTCDDDGGQGNCPRMLLSATLSYSTYEVKYASMRQLGRVYARNSKASGIKYIVAVDRLTPGSEGPKNTPTLSCY